MFVPLNPAVLNGPATLARALRSPEFFHPTFHRGEAMQKHNEPARHRDYCSPPFARITSSGERKHQAPQIEVLTERTQDVVSLLFLGFGFSLEGLRFWRPPVRRDGRLTFSSHLNLDLVASSPIRWQLPNWSDANIHGLKESTHAECGSKNGGRCPWKDRSRHVGLDARALSRKKIRGKVGGLLNFYLHRTA